MSDRDKHQDERELLISYLEKIDINHRRLEDKVDIIIVKQNDMFNHVERNTDSLVEHMKRTDIAEKRLHHVEKHITRMDSIIDLLTPTKAKVMGLLLVAALVFGVVDTSSEKSITEQIIHLIK